VHGTAIEEFVEISGCLAGSPTASELALPRHKAEKADYAAEEIKVLCELADDSSEYEWVAMNVDSSICGRPANVVAVVDSSSRVTLGFMGSNGIPGWPYIPTGPRPMPPPYAPEYIPFIPYPPHPYPPYPPSAPTPPYMEEP
jgi:hypothetical protein